MARLPQGPGSDGFWVLDVPTTAQTGVVYYFLISLWQHGGDLFSNDYQRVTFHTDRGVKTLSLWQRMTDEGIVDLHRPDFAFESGQALFQFSSSARIPSTYKDLPFRFGVAPLPAADFRATGIGGRNLAIVTTDPATDSLELHAGLHKDGYTNIRPTFRPDGVVNLDAPGWRANIDRLSDVAGVEVVDCASLVRALEQRRWFFKQLGATATDHSTVTPATARLSDGEADAILARALRGRSETQDAARFTAHMLLEMARMSVEDGLVMQLHVGSLRNHNRAVFDRFGLDMGADIPVQTEWTRNLHELLNAYGHDPRFRLILFTLDESSYSRELAPLAGHYPAVLLGPPWWFYDSVNGMQRYLDQVIETAGLANTAGFNDDTRAFASIPTRHDVWRRVACNWLAGLAVRGLLDEQDAAEMAHQCAYGLAKRAYRIPEMSG